ncbi:hypothetical protein [Avibacterium paragallinarum]|nr:hypothetical protein [Avibacterium paragallinarum]
MQIVEEGVRKWNAKKGRQSELGQGIYSADELWRGITPKLKW